MNKTAIKNYAMQARRDLIKAVCQKAYDIGVTPEGAMQVTTVQGGFIYNGVTYGRKELEQRTRLVDEITRKSDKNDYAHGYKIVMEEVAYTWFNRFIALRFMEVNGYLPSGVSILSSENKERLEPDCIRNVEMLDFVDMSKVADFKDDTSLYKYILIAQCNALSSIMPKMFQRIENYTELLLPDSLYQKGGLIYDLVHADIDFTEQVEVIGWLYQFYITEKKDEVFANLKKNVKITKENIPAATQLFTPDWIVKYMVENSLGRIAVEKLNIDPVYMGWKYYLPEAQQTDEVKNQLQIISDNEKDFDIKNLKLIDPCMGSGHILVYAFDVLCQIYEHLGHSSREIANLILENNIYGLDIDDRAGQLAYFALMMKARNYSRRFFRQDNIPEPNVYAMIESENWEVENNDLKYLIDLFKDAKEYGSILKIEKALNYDEMENYIKDFEPTMFLNGEKIEFIKEIIKIAKILTTKYDVVVTNPPYMTPTPNQADFVKKNYPDSKTDLFAIFIEKCGEFTKQNGYQAMITMHSWMFLSSYEKLRNKLINKNTINMAHLGARAFEEIGGEVVQTTAFVFRNTNIADYKATFVRLVDFNSQQAKEHAFLTGDNRHIAQKENFEKIPGMPVAYWVSENFVNAFNIGTNISKFVDSFQGIITGDNNKFLRYWHEVETKKLAINKSEMRKINLNTTYWIPYNKGGEFRKWYGNQEYVVYWKNGPDDKTRGKKTFENYYLREYVSWSYITSSTLATRYFPKGFLWDVAGSGFFDKANMLYYLQAFLGSEVGIMFLQVINPTINYQVENILQLPILLDNTKKDKVDNTVKQNIEISKTDWDSFETSWDFITHPLVNLKNTMVFTAVDGERKTISYIMQGAYNAWKIHCDNQFNELKSNEEELNRIFIDIYGLQDELTPEVLDKDVTIRKADLTLDIKSFISYAVGCMFGRYSLDEYGLAFAGGKFDESKYKTFKADQNNILPITDNDYFDDDIVARFIEFVKVVYGEQTLDQNLQFIANALYPTSKDSAKNSIRRYFLNDFYKDHIKTYQKRPIYWQFNSGKQDAFKALVYLHRYDKYTVARVRTDYLHPLQRKYEAEIKRLEMLLDMDSTNPREVAEYKKQIANIVKKIDECRLYDQAIAHIAHQSIELDLDDGVTKNYAKFQNIEVPQGDGKPTLKMDLLGKI